MKTLQLFFDVKLKAEYEIYVATKKSELANLK